MNYTPVLQYRAADLKSLYQFTCSMQLSVPDAEYLLTKDGFRLY